MIPQRTALIEGFDRPDDPRIGPLGAKDQLADGNLQDRHVEGEPSRNPIGDLQCGHWIDRIPLHQTRLITSHQGLRGP